MECCVAMVYLGVFDAYVPLLIVFISPQAIFFYWMTSNFYSLLYGLGE